MHTVYSGTFKKVHKVQQAFVPLSETFKQEALCNKCLLCTYSKFIKSKEDLPKASLLDTIENLNSSFRILKPLIKKGDEIIIFNQKLHIFLENEVL